MYKNSFSDRARIVLLPRVEEIRLSTLAMGQRPGRELNISREHVRFCLTLAANVKRTDLHKYHWLIKTQHVQDVQRH